jgi:hypothetical protein
MWQETGRMMDQHSQQVACDAAAATADHIVTQRELDEGLGHGIGSYRDRRNSFNAYPMSGYAGSMGGSVYGGSSPLMAPGAISMPGSPYMGGGLPYASAAMPMSYGGGGYLSPYPPGYEFGGYPGSLPGTATTVLLPPAEEYRPRHRHRHHHHHRRHRSHDRY